MLRSEVGEVSGFDGDVARGPQLGVLSELTEGLDVRTSEYLPRQRQYRWRWRIVLQCDSHPGAGPPSRPVYIEARSAAEDRSFGSEAVQSGRKRAAQLMSHSFAISRL